MARFVRVQDPIDTRLRTTFDGIGRTCIWISFERDSCTSSFNCKHLYVVVVHLATHSHDFLSLR